MPAAVGTIFEEQSRKALSEQRPVSFEAVSTITGNWVEVRAYPSSDGLSVYFTDITERKRVEEALAAAKDQLAADLDAMTRLQTLAALSVREENMQVVLDEIIKTAIAITKADMGNIQLLDKQSGCLKIMAHRGFEQPFLDFWNTVAEGKGACGTALKQAARVIVEDVTQSPIFVGTPALDVQLAAGVRAVQSTPLLTRAGEPLGMFSTHFRSPHRPDARALRMLDLLTRQAADIIERAQIEEALRESEEQFRRAIEDAPIPVIVHAEDGAVLQISSSWTELTGYRLTDLPTLDAWLNKAYGEGADVVRDHVRALFEGDRRSIGIEFPIRTIDGKILHWSFSASSPGMLRDGRRFIVGMAVDITERKKAEEDLRKSEEQFRRAIDEAPIPIIMHAEDGEVLLVSRTWTSLTGYAKKDIRTFDEWTTHVVYGEGADEVRNHLRRLFTGSSSSSSSRCRCSSDFAIRTKAGEIRYWSFSASVPGMLRDGRRFVVGMAMDITDRKRAEDALKRSNEELAASNKELDAFVYSVSHDLHAPLRIMEGFSKIAAEDYADKLDAAGLEHLGRIRGASERMSGLIEDLLRLSRISRQEPDRVDYDLSRITRDVVSALRAADKTRNVEVAVADGLRALIDPNLMKIALSNLLQNAWKFTSKTENARIEFGAATQDGKVVYFIRDNGVGFDPTYAAKMFLPFQRLHTEKEFEGTGIGLAIVERVIRRHGGRIWAEGEVGKGATIYFSL